MASSVKKPIVRQVGHYKIIEHHIDPFDHLNRVTTIMGTSGSGKTVVAKNIIRAIAPYISVVFLVSPTESSNGSFTDIVPKAFMHDDLEADMLDKIMTRQRDINPFYKKANQIEVLRTLYLRHPSTEIDRKIKDADDIATELQRTANLLTKEEERSMKRKEIAETNKDKKISYYKSAIKANKSAYKHEKLSEAERITLTFLDFNPNFLLIIEDSADKFKERKIAPKMREILYKSRHYRMTTIIICQNESDMTPNLRTNSHVTIFTKDEVAMGFFEKSRVPKQLVSDYKAMIAAGFFTDYRVMFYYKDDPKDRIRSFKGDEINKIKVGSKAFLEYAKKIEKEDELDESNPYYAELFGREELSF